jgi:hypothetical protein
VAEGKPCRCFVDASEHPPHETDGDGDGPGGITQRSFYRWDEDGNLTIDIDNDGEGPEGLGVRLFIGRDAAGRAVSYEADPDGDGPGEAKRRIAFTIAPIDRWGAAIAQRRVY